MQSLTIVRVTALPEVLAKNTLYFLKSADGDFMDIYLTSADGSYIRHASTQEETINAGVIESDTAPPFPNKARFWWSTAEGNLYFQHKSASGSVWVEASPGPTLPEFGGTGTSNKMARADHNHDEVYVKIGNNEW